MTLRTDSKNSTPFPSEDAFRQTLNALAHSRFVYVDKQGNLSRAHTFSLFALSRIFSLLKSRGEFDRPPANRRLVELKVMEFLFSGKDWLMPKDLKLIMTLAQKAGLTQGKPSEEHHELRACMKLLAQEIFEKKPVKPKEYETICQQFKEHHRTLLIPSSKECDIINAVFSSTHPTSNQSKNQESSAQEEGQGASDYGDEQHTSLGRRSDHQGCEKVGKNAEIGNSDIDSVAMINVGMNQPEVLNLNQQLDSGASQCPVFLGTRNGKEVIVKLVHAKEATLFKLLTLDKHEYVIKFIDSITFNDFKQLYNEYLSTESVLHTSYKEALVMEKLSLANFYDDKEFYKLEYALDPRYSTLYQDELNIKYNLKLDINTIRHMIECVENIEYMHSKNISHGDIKLGNLGIDEKGRVKFFDFGEACTVKDTVKRGHHELNPKKNDVIALGKLFINMMAGKALIVVGRHYMFSRTTPAECNKKALFQRLEFANMDLKEIIEKMLDFESAYDENVLKDVIEKLKQLEAKIN